MSVKFTPDIEPIDTNTVEGKMLVMQLSSQGRKIAVRRAVGNVHDSPSEWEETPIPMWQWGTSDYAVIHELPAAEPYAGGDVKQALNLGVPVYSVDFGEEGFGLYVRLTDFNRVLPGGYQGYVDAFRQTAEILGVVAPQACTPKEVWETQMLPLLCSRLLKDPPANVFERDEAPDEVWVEVCEDGVARQLTEDGLASKGYVAVRYVRADE